MKDYSQKIDEVLRKITIDKYHTYHSALEFKLHDPQHENYFANYFKSLLKEHYVSHYVCKIDHQYIIVINVSNDYTKRLGLDS